MQWPESWRFGRVKVKGYVLSAWYGRVCVYCARGSEKWCVVRGAEHEAIPYSATKGAPGRFATPGPCSACKRTTHHEPRPTTDAPRTTHEGARSAARTTNPEPRAEPVVPRAWCLDRGKVRDHASNMQGTGSEGARIQCAWCQGGDREHTMCAARSTGGRRGACTHCALVRGAECQGPRAWHSEPSPPS